MRPKLNRCDSDHAMYDSTLINLAKVLTNEHASKLEKSADHMSYNGDSRTLAGNMGAINRRNHFQRRNSSYSNATSLEEFLSWGKPPGETKGVPVSRKSFHVVDNESQKPKSILRTSSYVGQVDPYVHGKGKSEERSFSKSMPNLGFEDNSACGSTNDESFVKPSTLRRSSSSVSFSDMSELFLFPDDGTFPDEGDVLDFLSDDLPTRPRSRFRDVPYVPTDKTNERCVGPRSTSKTNHHSEKKAARNHLAGIVNLKWAIPRTNISGFYSGTINAAIRPHGKGKIISSTNPSDVIYGEWNDGKLVRECECNDQFLSEIHDGVKDQWDDETKTKGSQRDVSKDGARASSNRSMNSLVEDFLFFGREVGKDDNLGFDKQFFQKLHMHSAPDNWTRNCNWHPDSDAKLNVAMKQMTSSRHEDSMAQSTEFRRGNRISTSFKDDALLPSPVIHSRKVSVAEKTRSNKKTQSRRHSTGEFLDYDDNETSTNWSVKSNLKAVLNKKKGERMQSKCKFYDFALGDPSKCELSMMTKGNILGRFWQRREGGSKQHLTGIVYLKWKDPMVNVHGLFSGTINSAGRPHGNGKFSVGKDDLEVIYGVWDDGNLVKKCVCDEKFLSKMHKGEEHQRKCAKTNTLKKITSTIPLEEYYSQSTESRQDSPTKIIPKSGTPPGLQRRSSRRSSFRDKNIKQTKMQSRRHSTGDFLKSDDNERLSPRSLDSGLRPILKENKSERMVTKCKPMDYVLGEPVRTPNDMIICSTADESMKSISNLKLHDFAFIRRSNGKWTYAIVANRENNFAGKIDDENTDEVLLFVIDETGTTKRYRKRHWKSHIRRVRT